MIDPSFQRVNRFFVLSFENRIARKSHKQYFLPTAETEDYIVMIDGRNFFDQPVKDNLKTYDNIKKVPTGQGDDYKTVCLLDYHYFRKYHKLIAIDLSKKLDYDLKAI